MNVPLPQFKLNNYSKKEVSEIKRKFELYLKATELSKKPKEVQVAHLRLCFDEKINDVIDNLQLEEPTVEELFKALEDRLSPKENACFQQLEFFKRTQKQGESFNEFYINLENIAKYCEFGEQKDSIIKMRVLIGIADQNLKERLFRNPELSLKDIVQHCKSAEEAKSKINAMNNDDSPITQSNLEIMGLQSKFTPHNFSSHRSPTHSNNTRSKYQPRDKVRQSQHGYSRFPHPKTTWRGQVSDPSQPQEPRHSTQTSNKCSKCLMIHGRNCPAYGRRCHLCGKFNHYEKACRNHRSSSNVRSVKFNCDHESENESSDETPGHIHTVCPISTVNPDDTTVWYQKFTFDKGEVLFKLDTGADINVIPLDELKKIRPKLACKLTPCNIRAEAYAGHKLNFLGKIKIKLRTDKTHTVVFHVIESGKGTIPILGGDTSELLGLVKRCYINNLEKVNKKVFVEKFKSVFHGTGKFPCEYNIKLRQNEAPSVRPPRRVPYALKDKLEEKLNQLEKDEIIVKIDNPESYCSHLVVVEKPNGELRLCLDPVDLNKDIEREYYLVPTLSEIKYKLAGKRIFSVIDLKDGFHQVPLSANSTDLCTFSTPYGYYKYLRLPFGLVSSPEVFMKFNNKCFGDIEDIVIYMDDILIASTDEESHLKTLHRLFNRALELNIKFNYDKFQFMTNEIKYLGHIFNSQGCQPDPDRISSVLKLKPPTNVKELQSILGFFGYLREFIPNMAEITNPLRILLKKSVEWHWTDIQQQAFDQLKEIISKPPTLRNFDPKLPTILQCDASSHGLGCVILQNNQPVGFASRSLTETEKSYPQIEKELLAILFSCKRFHNYIWGSKITVQTDHLPLVSIFKKNLCNVVSNRCTKMRLALLQYNLNVIYLPGSKMYLADLLSRNHSENAQEEEMINRNHVHNIYREPTVLSTSLVAEHTQNDSDLQQVVNFCVKGWPSEKNMLPKNEIVRHFYKLRNELLVSDEGVLYTDDRMIIPKSLKNLALKALHVGHQGVTKTILRAKSAMYWININNDIESFIKCCLPCQENLPKKPNEPLLPYKLPERPFQRLHIDIMYYDSKEYLVVFDSYSKWIEMYKLNSKRSCDIISKLKLLFSTFGIPDTVVSDNSPFASQEVQLFAKEYNIEWITSSPNYPRSNGQSERAVQTCKNLLKKANVLKTDYLELLMEYRATPIPSLGLSPSELLMGRLINTKVPVNTNKLKPIKDLGIVHDVVMDKMKEYQVKYKEYCDKNTKSEKPFEKGENILVQEGKKWVQGKVTDKSEKYPRSYFVETNRGNFRRNSLYLKRTAIKYDQNTYQDIVNKHDNYDDFLENRQDQNVQIVNECNINPPSNLTVIVDNDHPSSSQTEIVNCVNPSSSQNETIVNYVNLSANQNETIVNLSSSLSELDVNIVESDGENDTNSQLMINIMSDSDSDLDYQSVENSPFKLDHDYLKTTRKGRIITIPKRYKE